MKRALYVVVAGLFITAAIVGVARGAFHPQRRWCMQRGPWGHPPLAYVAHELNLTSEQTEQIRSIWTAELASVKPMLRQLANEHSQMPLPAGAFDETKARTVADRQAAIISRLLVERQRLISKIYNDVLTPAQRVKADQLRQRMSDHIEHFLERRQHDETEDWSIRDEFTGAVDCA